MNGPVLAARVGLLGDLELARPHELVLGVRVHGGSACRSFHVEKPLLRLRAVDHLAAGEGRAGATASTARRPHADPSSRASFGELLVVGDAPAVGVAPHGHEPATLEGVGAVDEDAAVVEVAVPPPRPSGCSSRSV